MEDQKKKSLAQFLIDDSIDAINDANAKLTAYDKEERKRNKRFLFVLVSVFAVALLICVLFVW